MDRGVLGWIVFMTIATFAFCVLGMILAVGPR